MKYQKKFFQISGLNLKVGVGVTVGVEGAVGTEGVGAGACLASFFKSVPTKGISIPVVLSKLAIC